MGHKVINLSIGEPDFASPASAKQGVLKAIDDGFTHYSPVPGFLDVREGISKKLKKENGLDFTADEISISTGAKQSLYNLFMALVNPGDEVLLPTPYWVSYIAQAQLAGAKVVEAPTSFESHFKLKAEDLDKYLTNKTKLLVFSSPSNPSGMLYSEEELSAWVEVIKKYPKLIVVSDEIYEYLNYTQAKHQSLASFEEIKDRVILVNGFSKGFAMTGWRLGYLASKNNEIVKACNKLQSQATAGTCTVAQKAALAVLNADRSEVTAMKEEFSKRRDYIFQEVSALPGFRCHKPDGAFYLFPDIQELLEEEKQRFRSDLDFCTQLLEKAHVATVPGSAFGLAGTIRISYGSSMSDLKEAVKRLKSFLAR